MHLADPVDAVVHLVQLNDLRNQQLIAQLPGRGRSRLGGPVATSGHEPHLGLPHDPADELDPETRLHLIDEADHLDEGRPSSVAKDTLTDRRISFAFSSFNDSWVESIVDVDLYFEESGWDVEWLD